MVKFGDEEGRCQEQQQQIRTVPLKKPPPYSETETSVMTTLPCENLGPSSSTFNRHFEDLGTDDEDIEMDSLNVRPSVDPQNRNILFGINSTSAKDLTHQHSSLKEIGLKRLTPRQHFTVAISRDISLVLILKNLLIFWTKWYKMIMSPSQNSSWTAVWATEFFLAGIWCLVSALLSYCILDGLMARWMVMYTLQGAVIRILSISLLIISLIELLNYMFNNSKNEFCLAAWIIISCVLTFIFIVQNYVTSNLRLNEILLRNTKPEKNSGESLDDASNGSSTDRMGPVASPITGSGSLHRRIDHTLRRESTGSCAESHKEKFKRPHRTVDLYNLTVFAVVPIGVASFITMCGLVRLVVILRLDIGLKISKILPQKTLDAASQLL